MCIAIDSNAPRMPPSMRVQRAKVKQRVEKRATEQKNRQRVLSLVGGSESIRDIASKTGVSQTLVYRIRRASKWNDNEELEKLLNHVQHHAGRNTVLEKGEEDIIVSRVYKAAKRGFAIDNAVMKTLQAQISADGRKGFVNDVPSNDALRSFRARNPSITFRASEDVTTARLAAENFEHVKSLKTILLEIGQKHPGLFHDPKRIWNWDETSIGAKHGKKNNCYTPASSHHGGLRLAIKDDGKHVTAGIAVSAAGGIAPLFLVAAGKNKMARWLDPLDRTEFCHPTGEPHWLTDVNWFPDDTTICVTNGGSIDQKTISDVVRHINAHITETVPTSEAVLLLLDGHSSRECFAWLELCEKFKIEVVKLPANTTHFLQPVDNAVNKSFKTTMRETRDMLLSMCHIGIANVAFKMKLAVAAYKAITPEIAIKSFKETGMWPMDYRFLNAFDASKDIAGPAHALQSGHIPPRDPFNLESHSQLHRMAADRKLMHRIHEISDGRMRPSRALSEIALLMQSKSVFNRICESNTGLRPQQKDSNGTNFTLAKGNEAEHMTVANLKKKYEEKRAAKARKQRKKGQGTVSRQRSRQQKTPAASGEITDETEPENDSEDSDEDSLDDVPIGHWKIDMTGVRGGSSGVKHVANSSEAAMGLLRLRKRR